MFDGAIELGNINADTGALSSSSTRTRITNFIKVEPNTTYTFTRQVGQIRWIIGYTANKTGITDGNFQNHPASITSLDNGVLSKTFTTTATTEYIKWYDTNCTNTSEAVMLNEGTTALPYEPYGNNWYIEKNIGKVVLTGANTEGWTKVNNCFQTSGVLPSDIANVGQYLNALSSHFKYEYWASGITSNMTNNCFGWNTGKKLTMRYDTCSTASDFATWLGNNNVTIYYQLANPTYETITNENLIEQLNNIQDMQLIENLCYVEWVGEEKPTMKLFCYLDKDKIIEEITD